MTKSALRTALYARVSMKDKRQDTENQLSQLRQFCESQDWKVVHEYVDRASGKRSDREQFQKLFEDASQRKFDVVLFWALDRFSREGVRETLNHLERLTSYGVNYRSFTEQYLDSCGIFKDAVLAILAVIAKQGRVGGRPRMVVRRGQVAALRAKGLSITAISEKMQIPRTSVHRILEELA